MNDQEHREPGLHITGLSDDPVKREASIQSIKDMDRAFSPKGNKEFLKELGVRILEGMELSEDLRQYIGRAFIDIADGKTVVEAFNMKGKGRPKDKEATIKHLRISVEIRRLMNTGISFEKSAYQVSEQFNVSDHTAEKAYKRYSKLVSRENGIELMESFINKFENSKSFEIRHWLDCVWYLNA